MVAVSKIVAAAAATSSTSVLPSTKTTNTSRIANVAPATDSYIKTELMTVTLSGASATVKTITRSAVSEKVVTRTYSGHPEAVTTVTLPEIPPSTMVFTNVVRPSKGPHHAAASKCTDKKSATPKETAPIKIGVPPPNVSSIPQGFKTFESPLNALESIVNKTEELYNAIRGHRPYVGSVDQNGKPASFATLSLKKHPKTTKKQSRPTQRPSARPSSASGDDSDSDSD